MKILNEFTLKSPFCTNTKQYVIARNEETKQSILNFRSSQSRDCFRTSSFAMTLLNELFRVDSLNIIKIIAIIFILLFSYTNILAFSSDSSDDLDIFGYFETQYMPNYLHNEYSQIQSNKLRLDVESNINQNVMFGANFDYINYNGKKIWNILDFFSDDIVSSVPIALRPFYQISYKDTFFLDNAYMKLMFRRFDLTIGKQQISLGSGYAWNPIDVFNYKNLLDPTYEQIGHNAIRLDVMLTNSFYLMCIYAPEDNWENSIKLLRFKGNIGHFDLSANIIEKQWTLTDYFTYYSNKYNRKLYAIDLTGELIGLGVWSEIAYNEIDEIDNAIEHKDFWEGIIGCDYTCDFGLYFILEYYHNSSLKTVSSTDEKYNLNDWMQYFMQEKRSLSQEQIYNYISYPLTDLIRLDNSTIININDQSMILIPTFNYSIFENVDCILMGNFNLGEEDTMFGKNLGNGGIVRVKVYF